MRLDPSVQCVTTALFNTAAAEAAACIVSERLGLTGIEQMLRRRAWQPECGSAALAVLYALPLARALVCEPERAFFVNNVVAFCKVSC